MAATSHYTYSHIPLPPSANPKYFFDLGRRVEGFDASTVTEEQMAEIIDMLYKVCPLLGHVIYPSVTADEPTALDTPVQRPQTHSKAAIRDDSCPSCCRIYWP